MRRARPPCPSRAPCPSRPFRPAGLSGAARAPRGCVALLVAAAVALGGCAATPGPAEVAPAPPAAVAAWLQDAAFAPPGVPPSTAGLLLADDAMRRYLARDLAGAVRRLGPQAALIDALYRRDGLQLTYDGTTTRTAADAFAARSGNCLSLVLLTAALAGELGLPVRFQSAVVEDAWSRDGDLHLESGHVNVTIVERATATRRTSVPQPTTIDFLAPADLARLPLRPIGVERVEAMFANNRAVEALARGAVDDAYAWARHAVHRDPTFASAWNTLGVVYLRRGLLAPAAAVFDAVASAAPATTGRAAPSALPSASPGSIGSPSLALDPSPAARSRALSNLATALDRQGRAAEADAARVRLAAIDARPPLHFHRLGLAAATAGDWAAARRHFEREAERSDGWHEAHFWVAVAASRLGDTAGAARALARAGRASADERTRARYADKLASLQAAGARAVLR